MQREQQIPSSKFNGGSNHEATGTHHTQQSN